MGSLSIGHWLIVLLIVLLIFGTKKLRNMGGDLGGAIKNFKQSMKEGEAEADGKAKDAPPQLASGEDAKAEAARKQQDSKV